MQKIIDFPDYSVDKEGNVFSHKYNKIKQLKSIMASNGYRYINLYIKGKIHHVKIARLVALTFIKYDKTLTVNHINGNKSDDRLSNLELVTQSQNTKHAYAIGLMSRIGSKHNRAQINEEIVGHIRRLLSEGMSCREVSKSLKVSFSIVRHIKTGDRWTHVR